MPSSHTERPGKLWPPPRTATKAVLPSEPDGVTDIGDASTAGDEAGAPIDGAVPHLAVLVVAAVGRADELAPERRLELVDSTAVDQHALGH